MGNVGKKGPHSRRASGEKAEGVYNEAKCGREEASVRAIHLLSGQTVLHSVHLLRAFVRSVGWSNDGGGGLTNMDTFKIGLKVCLALARSLELWSSRERTSRGVRRASLYTP